MEEEFKRPKISARTLRFIVAKVHVSVVANGFISGYSTADREKGQYVTQNQLKNCHSEHIATTPNLSFWGQLVSLRSPTVEVHENDVG